MRTLNTYILRNFLVTLGMGLGIMTFVLLSGNLLPRLQGMLAGTPVAVITALGSGRVISFSIDPSFRAVWYGTSKLTANAIFWPEMISAATLR